jgi:hypothetical protein
MVRPPATFLRTGQRLARSAARLPPLYRLARELCPEGFTAEQTSELDPVRRRIAPGLVRRLRREVARALHLPFDAFRPRRFSAHGCGPVSLHDDKLRFPGVYFAIVVVHAGRLGIVDHRRRATRHATGEILLLDPYLRHALVPAGRTAREHPYERTHSPVRDPDDQFMFLCFDVPRAVLRDRFLGRAPTRRSAHRRGPRNSRARPGVAAESPPEPSARGWRARAHSHPTEEEAA